MTDIFNTCVKYRRKRAGAPCKRLRPPFLRLWGCFLLPWASRLGGGSAPYSVAEVGAFVAVKEKQ